MSKYPAEYSAFKDNYPELIKFQKKLARKFSQNAQLKLFVYSFGALQVVGYVPESKSSGERHLTVNPINYTQADLSDAGFLLLTLSIAITNLWVDIEQEDFKAFEDLLNLYVLRDTPESEKVNFEMLKEKLAVLHRDIEKAYLSHFDRSAIIRMLD